MLQTACSSSLNLSEAINKILQSNDALSQIQILKDINLCIKAHQSKDVERHYVNLIECLLSKLQPGWLNMSRQNESLFFDRVFLEGSHHDAWLVLNKYVQSLEPSYKLDKILQLIETFVLKDKLSSLFVNMTEDVRCNESGNSMDVTVTSIVAFPENMANKLKFKNKDLFLPKNFFKRICEAFIAASKAAHHCIQNGKSVSVKFLSKMLDKLSMNGRLDIVLEDLIPFYLKVSESDFIWRRVIQLMFNNVSDRSIETVITSVLFIVPWYGYVERFLGESVLTNTKLQFLMSKKLLIIKYFEKDSVIQNIVGYLSKSESRRPILFKLLCSLLEVWSDASAIKHTSYSQHLFITKSIFVCFGFIKSMNINIAEHKQELTRHLMHGIQSHIDSPQQSIRTIGMLTANSIMAVLDSSGPKLNFQLNEESIHLSLKLLMDVPPRPSIDVEVDTKLISDMEKIGCTGDSSVESDINGDRSSHKDVSLDSDDDLEPYDIPKETRKTRAGKPKYLRDCMLGLMEQDKPEWIQMCLECIESIVRANPDNIHENAEELSKILLHLDDTLSIPNFAVLRRNSMIATVVMSPGKAADYLTLQFYDRNYNIRQRLDILETLASAAQEISNIGIDKQDTSIGGPSSSFVADQLLSLAGDWKQIVDKRIKAKTRIISRGRTRPEVTPRENKFFKYAGRFFFPLVNYFDKSSPSLDLLGDDSFVLGRLIYTLGIFLNAASNSMIVKQMCSSMFQLIWMLRFHTESYVRQALIFAFSMILLSTPKYILMDEFQSELSESQLWLQAIAEQDTDSECQHLSRQALALLVKTIKQEIDGNG